MHLLTDIYGSISFRGRLLLMLVVVSLVQAGIAAYTFRTLQAKPIDERVSAQLNANLRAAAPLVDEELRRSTDRLQELRGNKQLIDALLAGDVDSVTTLLASPAPAIEGGERAPDAYVTGANGQVIAGTRPQGVLIDRAGVTTDRLVREDGQLVGELHVPVVIDEGFIMGRLEPYLVRGDGDDLNVFFTDGEHMVDHEGIAAAPRQLPAGEKTHEFEVDGEEVVLLSVPVEGTDVRVVATRAQASVAADRTQSVGKVRGFIFLLLAMTLLESIAITRAVGDALRKFASMARQLAGGDLARRIPVTGHDEVADLSESFNDMAENLEQRIENLIEARAKLRRQVDLFGEALANATDMEDMLQSVLALATESTSATHARFWVLDDEGRYEHAACIGLRPGDPEPCGLERAVAVQNASVRSSGTPQWLVVPARAGDQIVGLMTLVKSDGEFLDDDMRIAERLGVQAAVAIDNARMHEMLKLQATRDGLTGLPNHRSLQDALRSALDEAYDRGMPLGVALLDIDNFKRVNDTYGHPVGDEAIKALGQVLSHGVGEMGMAARYGGEEFVVLLPGCDADACCRIADRLREDVTMIEVPLDSGEILTFTASFGVANVDQNALRVDNAELLHQADVGLYNAKRTGKNRVYLAGPDTTVIEMSEAEKARLAARERGESLPEAA